MEHSYRAVLAWGGQLAMNEELPLCPEAKASLRRLMGGNAAYLDQGRNPAELTDLLRLRTAHEGQRPWAAVVCCADSRVPPEHIFSAGLGDLFIIRRNDHPGRQLGLQPGGDGVSDQRIAREQLDVLARNAFGSAAGGNDS